MSIALSATFAAKLLPFPTRGTAAMTFIKDYCGRNTIALSSMHFEHAETGETSWELPSDAEVAQDEDEEGDHFFMVNPTAQG